MRISLWGTRGSLPSAGPETVRYGGNTSCVELRDAAGALVVLDAGTGIRRLSAAVERDIRRLDILLTHLHMDHIQGFGFFEPLFRPELEVHVWGPPSTTHDLRTRLTKYLSPPLFPVRLRDLPCRLHLHDVPMGSFMIASLEVHAALVFHPGPTVGYRFVERGHSLVYIPDHEPALGARAFPDTPRWTSGHDLAMGAELLIHDAQFTDQEYGSRVGWGHSSIDDTGRFAELVKARRLVTFHHDPSHSDDMLDRMAQHVRDKGRIPYDLTPGQEGMSFTIGE